RTAAAAQTGAATTTTPRRAPAPTRASRSRSASTAAPTSKGGCVKVARIRTRFAPARAGQAHGPPEATDPDVGRGSDARARLPLATRAGRSSNAPRADG